MTSALELARRVSRSLFPQEAYLKWAATFGDAMSLLRLGAADYRRLRRARSDPASSTWLSITPPGLRHPVAIRPGTTDPLVFENNLVRSSYGCVSLSNEPRFIIDAGANVGYASAFFANRYPLARVVALEPDGSNAAMARRNLAPYGDRVTVVEAGLWPRAARLRVHVTERADSVWVEEVTSDDECGCTALDPMTLLRRFQQTRIDLLKCDIEGAEEALFRDAPDEWLERTQCIVAEIHGAAAARVVYDATKRHGFGSRQSRDLHVFTRARALAC